MTDELKVNVILDEKPRGGRGTTGGTHRHTDTQTHRDTEVSHSFDKNALY